METHAGALSFISKDYNEYNETIALYQKTYVVESVDLDDYDTFFSLIVELETLIAQ